MTSFLCMWAVGVDDDDGADVDDDDNDDVGDGDDDGANRNFLIIFFSSFSFTIIWHDAWNIDGNL